MEKIKLDLESIELQSFEATKPETRQGGTVYAHQTEAVTCNVDCTFAIGCTGAC
jgi:hypothetical protein